MKLYAQHGFGDGSKTDEGLADGSLDGVVFGAKDISPEKLTQRLAALGQAAPAAARLFDPQDYTCLLGSRPNMRMGTLVDYPYRLKKYGTKSPTRARCTPPWLYRNSPCLIGRNFSRF
jgi:hypothetical protein